MTTSALTKIEQEAIVLSAVYGMVDGMVNRSLFAEPNIERPSNLWFHSAPHKQLFSILLSDFLSQPQARGKNPVPFGLQQPENREPASGLTYLHYLSGIAQSPQISTDATQLGTVVANFANWLDTELVCEKVWLSGLEINFDMKVTRIWLLQTVGDMSKHNFSRLEGRIKQIQAMLKRHGHEVDEGKIYQELPVFYEWFHTHLFSYHYSTIAEFLNNIRWSIFYYLRPEYIRANARSDGSNTYDVPESIRNELARGMYWELMNSMRSQPIFPQFVVSQSLKDQF